MAEEALALHVEGMIAESEAIPEPSTLEEVMADPENRDGIAILVGLKSEAQKTVRVNVTLPADVLEQIDRFAERHGYKLLGFLVQAAKRVIEDEERTAA